MIKNFITSKLIQLISLFHLGRSAREKLQYGNKYDRTNRKDLRRNEKTPESLCHFCFRSGQVRAFCRHQLRDNEGNTKCPVLIETICGDCGATGNKVRLI